MSMLSASIIPEVWPAGPATRPCYGATFVHPATENNPATIYDNYGHCLPGMTAVAVAPSSGMSFGTIILIAGVAIGGYFLYKNRKRIFA